MSADNETLRDLASRFGRSELISRHHLNLHDLERLSVPDSRPCREAERLCRQVSSPALANHCFRSYAWAALLGVLDDLTYDAELLYTAAMLHDIGLTATYDRGRCFESDGSIAAREILAEIGWPVPRCEIVAEAIYLHMHDVAESDTPEARLLALGAAADVTGGRALDVKEPERAFVLALFPRRGFKNEIIALFEDQARRKPFCIVRQYLLSGIGDRIMNAPFED